jgi:CDP-diacylglycerol--glycerol-3-phosphate 3-phosphatidyltransferase
MTAVNPLPNILTWLRLIAGLVMFTLLAGAAGGIPFLSDQLVVDAQFELMRWAFYAFVLGAVTDFFDGFLARKLHAETAWGATLDPIADKILVCGTILGLFALRPIPEVAVPAALILFREFAVSALRESAASRGVKLNVTWLAKWKTTLQLVGLGLLMLVEAWAALGLEVNPDVMDPVRQAAVGLIWVAAAVTLWTGWDYVRAARRAIPHEN